MIINQVLFLAFLTVVSSFNILGSAAASSASDPFRISCIQLKPYDASQSICKSPHNCGCEDVSVGVKNEAKYIDIHGLGSTFDYVTPEEGLGDTSTPGTHAYFLKQVVDHKQANFTKDTKDDERNTLFVRMQCKFLVQSVHDEQTEQSVDFYLGLFVSGRADYYPQTSLTAEKYLPDLSVCPQGAQDIVKKICQPAIDLADKYNQEAKKIRSEIALNFAGDNNEKKGKVGGKKSFSVQLPSENKKLYVFRMTSGLVSLDEGAVFIRKRLSDGNSECSEELTQQLFGRSKYDERQNMQPCFRYKTIDGKEDSTGLGYCFFDSEQSLISYLEGKGPVETAFNPTEGDKYELTKCTIFCYSFRDMCRFCRGTFTRMLQTGELQDKVEDFIKNKMAEFIKMELFSINKNFKKNVFLYAFGHEKTSKK